jgi:hypothetical protein
MEDCINPAQEKLEAAAYKPSYMNKAYIKDTADLEAPPLTTKNLISWSFQVARGMEYLASKKVRIILPCRAGHRISGF